LEGGGKKKTGTGEREKDASGKPPCSEQVFFLLFKTWRIYFTGDMETKNAKGGRKNNNS